MDENDQDTERASAPPSSATGERLRRLGLGRRPAPGAAPGTLVVEAGGERSRIFLIDYCPSAVVEKELTSIDEAITYLEDDTPSITWVDVRGICDQQTLERMGEIFKIHPLALADVVNVPQRPKTEAYAGQQVVISRMVTLGDDGLVATEQVGIIFGQG